MLGAFLSRVSSWRAAAGFNGALPSRGHFPAKCYSHAQVEAISRRSAGKQPRLLSIATEYPDRGKSRTRSVPFLGPWTDLLERPAQFVAEIDVNGRSAIVIGRSASQWTSSRLTGQVSRKALWITLGENSSFGMRMFRGLFA